MLGILESSGITRANAIANELITRCRRVFTQRHVRTLSVDVADKKKREKQ